MPPKTKTPKRAQAKAKAPRAAKEDHRGRKPSLSEDARKELLDCLMLGNSQKTAFTLAGLARATYYDWLKWGEAAIQKREDGAKLTENETFYSDFSDAVKKAIEQGKKKHMGIINSVAEGGQLIKESEYYDKDGNMYKSEKVFAQSNWQAAAWALERRHPEEFGRREKVTVDSKVEQTHKIEIRQVDELITSLPEEEVLRLVRDAKRDAGTAADDKELSH